MDCPWYEAVGPNSDIKKDFDLIKKDLLKYQRERNIYNPFNFTELIMNKIINYVIHEKFKSGKSCSWRGYGTFKRDIMFELSISIFKKSIHMNKLNKYIKNYISK